MKKTLVALAALAATGAFAQVSITGNVTMGYAAQTTGGVNGVGAKDTAGLGTDTSALTFKAAEDIGGGYKANIELGLDGINRGSAAPAGQDAKLTLTTPVVGITLATAKGGDYLSTGLATQGFFYYTFDGKLFAERTIRDSITFTAPIGAFTASYSFQESGGANATVGGGNGLGAGVAGDATATKQAINAFNVSYASGALSANAQYLSYLASGSAGATKDVYRLSGKYDLGAVALGLGAEIGNQNGGGNPNPKSTGLAFSVVAPLGNLTLGAAYLQRQIADAESVTQNPTHSGTISGYNLQATYALSKRTAVTAAYNRWTQAGAFGGNNAAVVTAGQDASSGYGVLLSHSF